jgi:hypothetical protein
MARDALRVLIASGSDVTSLERNIAALAFAAMELLRRASV